MGCAFRRTHHPALPSRPPPQLSECLFVPKDNNVVQVSKEGSILRDFLAITPLVFGCASRCTSTRCRCFARFAHAWQPLDSNSPYGTSLVGHHRCRHHLGIVHTFLGLEPYCACVGELEDLLHSNQFYPPNSKA